MSAAEGGSVRYGEQTASATWRDMTSFSMRLGEALVALCTPYLGTRQ